MNKKENIRLTLITMRRLNSESLESISTGAPGAETLRKILPNSGGPRYISLREKFVRAIALHHHWMPQFFGDLNAEEKEQFLEWLLLENEETARRTNMKL